MNLITILRFNALTTLPFVFFLLIFHRWISDHLGHIPIWVIITLALALLIFSISAWLVARSPSVFKASLINLSDIIWVASTTVFLISNPTDISLLAKLAIVMIDAFVMFNIIFQTIGIIKLKKTSI